MLGHDINLTVTQERFKCESMENALSCSQSMAIYRLVYELYSIHLKKIVTVWDASVQKLTEV